MIKNKVKLLKILACMSVGVVIAILATMAWFYFTLEPDMKMGNVQALEYGSLKLSATENGEDIGINGEIELDVDNLEGSLYPGASGSLTVWITSDTTDIVSYILTYTSAEPNTDESVFDKAKDIANRHILFFKERTVLSEKAVVDSEGIPVVDENGEPVMEYTYSYSDPLYPVGEYTAEDPVPLYRSVGILPFNVPQEETIYWIWPYDYAQYGEYGDYNFLFPEGSEATLNSVAATELYDEEDSYIGKVVQDMRFKFYVNGKRSILGL